MEDNIKLSIVGETTDNQTNPPADSVSDTHHAEHRHSHHSHHHHSHHHSRHGHHHRHKRRRSHHSSSKKNKFKTFLKQHKSLLINILSCTVSVILLIVLATSADKTKSTATGETDRQTVTQSTVKIETSIYSEKLSLVSDAISYYMDPTNTSTALETYRSFCGYKSGLNQGMPISFIYRVTGLPINVDIASAALDISENDTYEPCQTYVLDMAVDNIDIFNLKTGARYYYRLNLTLTNGCTVGTVGSFETENSPRILTVDGAVNVRDIGGWKTVDGKTIRQGLLFRGSELDGAVEPSYRITDKGFSQLTDELGIRFDLDLRPSTDNKDGKDALGRNVIHKYYNSPMYSDILTDDGCEAVKRIFAELANSDNYPIYMHCTYGRDRTGTICYLLEALLGVSDEDLYREYELSIFTDSYANYAEFETFTGRVRSFEGDSTKEKVEGWLLSIGVSAEEIESIREIFLSE